MKTKTILLLGVFALFLAFTGCEEDSQTETGTLSLALTDAPIDDENVTGVFITINELQYHKQNNSWATFEEYEGPKTVNLLELTDGMTEMMGAFEMEAGQYNQLRFILDAPIRGEGTPSNPGCYIEFSDGSSQPLYVPSGSESGFKATGAFRVPSNGEVMLTADFDARKSVVEASNAGMYILKPTIRLVVDNQAGKIVGNVTNLPDTTSDYIVYAYENDTYTESEEAEPDVEENRFPNAITSDMLGEQFGYQLNWLAPMTYDLVVTRYVDGVFMERIHIEEDVTVESRETTNAVIEIP